MEAVGRFQEMNNFFQVLSSFFSCNKTPFDTNKDRHHTETGATAGNNALIVLRIIVIGMKTFPGQSAHGLGPVPEVQKGLLLNQPEQSRIGSGDW